MLLLRCNPQALQRLAALPPVLQTAFDVDAAATLDAAFPSATGDAMPASLPPRLPASSGGQSVVEPEQEEVRNVTSAAGGRHHYHTTASTSSPAPPPSLPSQVKRMAQMLLSHVRSCQDESCQTCHRLRERIISRAASSSHGGPREPTSSSSWCSRWLPVVPLFSEETGGQQRSERAGVTLSGHSAAMGAAVMAEEMVAEMMVELIPVERVAPAAVRVVVAWALRGEAEVATVAAATVAETAAVEREGGANSSGARDATAAAALEERWANHWKAKEARATGLAPGTAAVPAALSCNACWPLAPPAHVAPSAPAAPAACHANPAAPTSLFIPSASGIGKQAVLTEVLDGLAAEEEFEELLGSALL